MATTAASAQRQRSWRHTGLQPASAAEGIDVFSCNLPLVEALQREGGGWAKERAAELGQVRRRQAAAVLGAPANENKPMLRTHDRYGNRIDEVEFHPAWHRLMAMGVENELHSLPWTSSEPAAHVAARACT